MIAGSRLYSMLAFQGDIIGSEITKAAGRFVELDRSLNLLRVDEALAWRDYARAGNEEPSVAPAAVKHVLDARHAKAMKALETVGEAEIELAAKAKPLAQARREAAEARSRFEAEESAADSAWRSSAAAARLVEIHAALACHVLTVDEWASSAKPLAEEAAARFEGDRIFAYLRRRGWGTPSYRGGLLASGGDAWLARRSGYDAAAASYEAWSGYEQACRRWIDDCKAVHAAAEAEADRDRSSAMAVLEGPRAALAVALNSLDRLETRVESLHAHRREAMHGLLELVLGRDEAYRRMVEGFIGLISKERAAAMSRMAQADLDPVDPAVASRIDAIVAERIRLSMETDGLRRHVSLAEKRLQAVEDVCEKLALRQWDRPSVHFAFDEHTFLPHDLASGDIDPVKAWQEIEAAQSAPMAAAA